MTDYSEAFDITNWTKVDKVKAWTGDETISAVGVEPWTAGGGLSGDAFVVTVTRGSENTRYFVKVTKETGLGISQAVGLAREGLFYTWAHSVPEIDAVIPKSFFSHGDMALGRKVTALELIDGDQAGFFYGSNSCHNWNKDLDAVTARYPGVTERDVTIMCVKAAASLHAPFWNRLDVLTTDPRFATLRYRDWVHGENRQSWEGVAKWAANGWAKAKPILKDKGVNMPEFLSDIMDASINKTTWEAFQEFVANNTLTLVQGDCHPSNAIIRRPDASGKCSVVLCDWEVVGIGSGPQDIGQFMVSHSLPATRRSMERDVVQYYVDCLKEHNVEVSFDAIWNEYRAGCLGRWVWLLGIMIGGSMPAPVDQYFINQVAAFAEDHGFSAATAPLMRV